MNLDLIKEEVAAGNIRAVTQDNLTLYNYTPQAQWSKHWNEATTMCRGLILDPDGNIVARPFPKFFNWGEIPEIHHRINDSVVVGEKVDGSLGILYNHPSGEVRVATRGSFSSEQALWATNWLHKTMPGLVIPPGITPLVEIIYPQNRIVIDYLGLESLIYLTSIDNNSGRDSDSADWWVLSGGNMFVHWDYDDLANVVEMMDQDGDYMEGYVVRFTEDDLRVKFKYADYVRLHRIITGTNAKAIWEHLALGDPMEHILDNVPDEFFKWASSIIDDLNNAFAHHEGMAMYAFEKAINSLAITDPTTRRKQFAERALASGYPGVLFAMYDNKPYQQAIWKLVRPAAERPFRTEEE
jgi:RNA ligase